MFLNLHFKLASQHLKSDKTLGDIQVLEQSLVFKKRRFWLLLGDQWPLLKFFYFLFKNEVLGYVGGILITIRVQGKKLHAMTAFNRLVARGEELVGGINAINIMCSESANSSLLKRILSF